MTEFGRRTLASLARLEAEGRVTKEVDPESRCQVVYTLTSKALDLAPMLIEMILWSAKHDPHSAAVRAFIRKAESDRRYRLCADLSRMGRERRWHVRTGLGLSRRASDPEAER